MIYTGFFFKYVQRLNQEIFSFLPYSQYFMNSRSSLNGHADGMIERQPGLDDRQPTTLLGLESGKSVSEQKKDPPKGSFILPLLVLNFIFVSKPLSKWALSVLWMFPI